MFIDTHAHLFKEYYSDLDDVILECLNNGVNKIIVSGCDMASNKEVLELVSKYDCIYGTLGFHPTELDDFKDEYFDWLEDNINNRKIVGVGEIGLDYHYEDTNRELQKKVFKRQLDIASRNGKPIVVHSRDAIGDTYNILKDYKLRGSIHAFSGSVEMAQEFIKLGYMIGVGGVVTFKNAKNIKEVVKSVPLAYILLETDSPYLTPEPYRGEVNSSKNIPLIANKIAELKEVSNIDVSRVTNDNAERIFDFSSK